MFRKKGGRAYNQSIINVVVLAVVLCLLVYIGVQLFGNYSAKVSTQRTQIITDVEYIYSTGYVFRDETLVKKEGGVIDYLVEDGERIGVGQTYAYFYPMPSAAEKEIDSFQAKVDKLSSRIALLDSGVSDRHAVSDLAFLTQTVSNSYYSYIDLVLDGKFESADRSGESLLGAIVDYRIITGRDGVAQNITSDLKEQKKELLSGLGAGQPITSNESYYFFCDTDGYENIFNSSAVSDMTASELDAIIKSPAESINGVIGKTLSSPKWYLAVPTNEAESLKFSAGDIYDITFSDNESVVVDMKLERIYIGEDGAYLLFSCFDLSLASDFARAQNIKIYIDSCTGYRIPEESLTKLYGEDGVYILVGNMVEFRRVTVIGKGNKYYIVNTHEGDSSEGVVSEIPYLNINDLIVTSGNDLYDGKLLD